MARSSCAAGQYFLPEGDTLPIWNWIFIGWLSVTQPSPTFGLDEARAFDAPVSAGAQGIEMVEDVELLWFVVFLIAVIIAIAAWPAWPYSRGRWGYAPSLGAGILAIFIVLLFWTGLIAVWWPWVQSG